MFNILFWESEKKMHAKLKMEKKKVFLLTFDLLNSTFELVNEIISWWL